MKKIGENLKGHYREVILGPLFKLFEAILELLVPLVMASIIDNGILKNDKSYIVKGGLLLIILAILGIIAAMICQYYAAVAGGYFGRNLRGQIYQHVMRLSGDEVDKYGTGGLITRLTSDANQIQVGINIAIRLATRVPFLALGSIIMALMINVKIGLIFLFSTPFIALVLYIIMKRTVPQYKNIQSGNDTLSRLAGENLEGARVIRAFSREENETQEFASEAEILSRLTKRVGKISALLNPLTSVIVNFAIIAIVWLGAGQVFQGDMQTGAIIALVSYMNQTLLAMIVAANIIVLFTRAIASAKRVAEVLETEPSIVDGAGAIENANAPIIAFQNASYTYHTGARNAIENISFSVEKGTTLGIIGGTGSGKSTLIKLLLRQYDCTSGVVMVQGADVREYKLPVLRGKIGLVPQTAALFTGTVRRNMQISAPKAEDKDIWVALEAAQAAEFVKQMPDRLDSKITEGGKNLSGGQRQRLTIARALVRKPEIVILDDASSALDYATDAALRKSLAILSKTEGLTTVMISQRASALQSAHKIIVLDDGQLAGEGTHEQLSATCEVYKEICASQGMTPKEPEVVQAGEVTK